MVTNDVHQLATAHVDATHHRERVERLVDNRWLIRLSPDVVKATPTAMAVGGTIVGIAVDKSTNTQGAMVIKVNVSGWVPSGLKTFIDHLQERMSPQPREMGPM